MADEELVLKAIGLLGTAAAMLIEARTPDWSYFLPTIDPQRGWRGCWSALAAI
jgi:hypothetical protein